jgi:hypothetical protein
MIKRKFNFLGFFSVFLSLIIVFEIFFLVTENKSSLKKTKDNKEHTINYFGMYKGENLLDVNLWYLKYVLDRTNKGIFKNPQLTVSYEVFVNRIEDTPKTYGRSGTPIKAVFSILINTDNEFNEEDVDVIWIKENEMHKVDFFEIRGGEMTPFSKNKLKRGDLIKVIETVDLTKYPDDNLLKRKIIKIG